MLRSGNNREAVPAGISAAFGQQYSCPENPHRQRSLEGYNPQGRKESDTIERLTPFLVSGRLPPSLMASCCQHPGAHTCPRVWDQPCPDSPGIQNLDPDKACAGGLGTLTGTGRPGVPLSFPTKGLGSPYLSQETDGLGSFLYHGHRQEGAGCLGRRGEAGEKGVLAIIKPSSQHAREKRGVAGLLLGRMLLHPWGCKELDTTEQLNNNIILAKRCACRHGSALRRSLIHFRVRGEPWMQPLSQLLGAAATVVWGSSVMRMSLSNTRYLEGTKKMEGCRMEH